VWWAWTWWFQFAHGPLCERFRPDTVRLGRARVCRSCALLYAGLAVTLVGVLCAGGAGRWLAPACGGLLVPLAVLSEPRLYRRLPRPAKDVLRAAAGVFLGLFLGLFATAWWWVAAAAAGPLLALRRAFARARRRVKARDCDGCPELGRPGVCSGYARQADAVRGYSAVIEAELNRPAVASLVVLGGGGRVTPPA
jgi:hypothetical protein